MGLIWVSKPTFATLGPGSTDSWDQSEHRERRLVAELPETVPTECEDRLKGKLGWMKPKRRD